MASEEHEPLEINLNNDSIVDDAHRLVYDDVLSPASRLNQSPTSLANHALHREVDTGDGLVETRTFVFEPTHPRTPSAAELRLKATVELERHRELQSAAALLQDDSDDSSGDDAAPPQRVASCPWQLHGSSHSIRSQQFTTTGTATRAESDMARSQSIKQLKLTMERAPSNATSSTRSMNPEAAAPKPVRWYRDSSHERGWNPGTTQMQSRPFGPASRQASARSQAQQQRRTSTNSPLDIPPARTAVSSSYPGITLTSLKSLPTPSSPTSGGGFTEASMLVRKTLQRPPSALPPIAEVDASLPRHSAPTASALLGDCGRCSHRDHHSAIRDHELLVQSLQLRAATPLAMASRGSSKPKDLSSRPHSRSSMKSDSNLRPILAGGPVDASVLSRPPPALPVSLRSMERLVRAKANALAPPACSHDDLNPCPNCEAVRKTIASFECVVMESAQASAGENSPLAKPMGVQSDDDSQDDREVNGADANSRALARRGSTFDSLIQPLRKRWRAKEKAAEQAQLNSQGNALHAPPTRTKSPPRATIAELYFDTTHRDREDLYISVVGGLSFDLTREKFRTMVMRVLAPRRNITVTDEQILNLFSSFDFNGGGTVSYFEYLHALCENLLSKNQQAFLGKLFDRLVATAATAAATQRRKRSPDPSRAVSVIPTEPSVNGESIPFYLNKSTMSSVGQAAPTPDAQGGDASRLGQADLTLDAIEKGVFDLLHKSLLFPHPEEAELALAIHTCLADLGPADRIEKSKFILLLFCDDDFIPVFRRHVT